MNARSYEVLRKRSSGKFTMIQFAQLKTLAKNTVGFSDDYLLQQMEVLLDIYTQLDAKIEEVEAEIIECIIRNGPKASPIA